MMSTNLDGAFLCSQACVPVMLQTGGGSSTYIASILACAPAHSGLPMAPARRRLFSSPGSRPSSWATWAIAPGTADTEMAKLVHSVAIDPDHFNTIALNH